MSSSYRLVTEAQKGYRSLAQGQGNSQGTGITPFQNQIQPKCDKTDLDEDTEKTRTLADLMKELIQSTLFNS